MSNAYHYQNTFDDGLASEFRETLSLKILPPFATKVEQFELTVSPGFQTETSRSLTLSQPFDKSRSFIQYLGFQAPSQLNNIDRLFFRLDLTDDNTVTATRGGLINTPVTVAGQVVEIHEDYIEQVIHGEITIGAKSLSATSITHDVSFDNSILVWTGNSSTQQFAGYYVGFANIKKGGSDGAVTVAATRHTANADTVTVGYNIIVLKSDVLAQPIQEVEIVIDENTDNYNNVTSFPAEATIDPIDMNQTLLFYGGLNTSVNNAPIRAAMGMIYLQDNTTVAASRYADTVHGSRTINLTASIATFKPSTFKSIETQNYLRVGDADLQTNFSLNVPLSNMDSASHL